MDFNILLHLSIEYKELHQSSLLSENQHIAKKHKITFLSQIEMFKTSFFKLLFSYEPFNLMAASENGRRC